MCLTLTCGNGRRANGRSTDLQVRPLALVMMSLSNACRPSKRSRRAGIADGCNHRSRHCGDVSVAGGPHLRQCPNGGVCLSGGQKPSSKRASRAAVFSDSESLSVSISCSNSIRSRLKWFSQLKVWL